jgi:MFS transporter, SET family, sugar efflux transporter
MLLAGYPLVMATPAFRALFVVLTLAGAANGMAVSYISVWASDTFGSGPQAVAMLFVVSGAAGTIGNPLLGLLSDRLGWRRQLIVGQLAMTALVYLTYTQTNDYSTALVLVAFSGFGVMGLVLAMVNDMVNSMPELEKGKASRIFAAERTAWSIGVIVGPALAAAIVTAAGGTRPVFAAAALTELVAIGVVCTVRAQGRTLMRKAGPSDGIGGAFSSTPARTIAMLVLFIAMVLVSLPNQTRTIYLPLFVTVMLGEQRGMVGPLFTVTAMTAVATMPYIGAASDRFGAHRVLYLGAIIGVAYCVAQTLSDTYPLTAANQVLMGLCIALWSTSSLIYLQELLPGRAGAAGGLYVASQQLTPVVAGLLLGPIAETSGIPAAFSATAVLCLMGFVLLARAHHTLTTQ